MDGWLPAPAPWHSVAQPMPGEHHAGRSIVAIAMCFQWQHQACLEMAGLGTELAGSVPHSALRALAGNADGGSGHSPSTRPSRPRHQATLVPFPALSSKRAGVPGAEQSVVGGFCLAETASAPVVGSIEEQDVVQIRAEAKKFRPASDVTIEMPETSSSQRSAPAARPQLPFIKKSTSHI